MLKLQRFYFRSAWSLPLIALLGTSPKLFADSFPTREIMLQEFATRFKATSVTEFFRKRDTDTGLDNCRKDLKAYSDAYIKARDKSQYAKMEDIMKRGPNPGPLGTTTRGLVDLMQQCGPCVTDVFHVGTIYNSDGWCRFPQVEAAKLSQSMAQIRALLTNAESYPKKKNGVFNYMLNFSSANEETKVAPFESPFLAYIAVKAMFGAMNYVAEVKYKDRETADKVKYFTMDFASADAPANFDPPTVMDPPLASAKDLGVKAKSPFFNSRLKNVEGRWMVDSDGNLRYFTTGDFTDFGEFPLLDFEWVSHLVLMDTIWNIYQRLGPQV